MPERTATIEPYLRVPRQENKFPKRVVRLRRVRLPSEFLAWETACALFALVLLTRLHLMGEVAPFGLAFWAVSSRGEKRRMAVYGVAMFLAAAFTGNAVYTLSLAAGAALFWLLWFRLHKLRLPFVCVIGLSVMAGSFPRVWLNFFEPYDLLLLTLETVMAMLAAAVFLQLYKTPPASLYPDRHIEGITSWIVFLGLLLLALVQEQVYLTLVAGAIARMIVLWSSFWFGPGIAAAAGALLGFMLGVQGTGFVWVSVLTFAGFMAGLFRPYGRLATSLGFLLGTIALALYITGWETVPVEFFVSALAIIIFLLGPVFPFRLQALAPFLKRGADDEAKKVRDLTAVRIHDYALVFRELSEAFAQAAAVEQECEPPLTELVETLVERVCKHCPSRRRCWEKDLQRTYNAMLRVLADLESGRSVRDMRSPEFFQSICRKKEEFLGTVSFIHELNHSGQAYRKRLDECRNLVTMQLTGLSQIMLDLAKEVREGISERQKKIRNQYFHVEIGVAQAAKGNEEVCGDYYSYLELRDGKQAFILSDGMGNGSRAQQESRSAVQLVEQLLLAGFGQDAVIRTVNTILQLRSCEESFATLDVLLVDTENGAAEYLKIGAAPSFMRLSERVREIKSPSVPLGILNEVELKPVCVQLEDDTVIVMVTDGILEASLGQPDWLKQYLAGQIHSHPQILADEIIHKANVLNGRRELRDDVTVLVCRIKRLKHKIRDFMTA